MKCTSFNNRALRRMNCSVWKTGGETVVFSLVSSANVDLVLKRYFRTFQIGLFGDVLNTAELRVSRYGYVAAYSKRFC